MEGASDVLCFMLLDISLVDTELIIRSKETLARRLSLVNRLYSSSSPIQDECVLISESQNASQDTGPPENMKIYMLVLLVTLLLD